MGECKPASQNLFYDDHAERYLPVLTVNAFAQVAREAITTWKHYNNGKLFRAGVYSYICNGTFIRFFHFAFGSRYAQYLNALTENEQLNLVGKHPEDTCIRVSSTKWLDLQSPTDTILSVCHILARLRLEEGHQAEDQSQEDHEAERQSGDAPEGMDISSNSSESGEFIEH